MRTDSLACLAVRIAAAGDGLAKTDARRTLGRDRDHAGEAALARTGVARLTVPFGRQAVAPVGSAIWQVVPAAVQLAGASASQVLIG